MKYVPRKIKDKYEILGIIGEGAYGVVLKAREKDENTLVAIKYFKQAPGYRTDADVIDRELKILQLLRFENVVELIEWYRDKKRCCLIFEYVEWNMLQVLQEHPKGLPLEHVRRLSYQLFSAIHWCHLHQIIHRDIKPENLLISKNLILKLCDFGFARFCNAKTSADYYTAYVATRWYRSPELLLGSPYGKPVDIWACGCIMAELKTGQALFAGENDIDQLYRIQKCLGPLPAKYLLTIDTNPKFQGLKFPHIHHLETLEKRFGHIFPLDMMHLFKNTLRVNSTDRLTAEKCIQHEAFACLYQISAKQQYLQSENIDVRHDISQCQGDRDNMMSHSIKPFVNNHSSKPFNANNEAQIQYQTSPFHMNNRDVDNLPDTLLTTPRSTNQQVRYSSYDTQLTDRSSTSNHHQPKIIRTYSRPYSSSSDEHSMFTPKNSNILIINDIDRNNILLSKPIPENHHPQQSIARKEPLHEQQQQQQPSTSSSLNCVSNGILLRPKPKNMTKILETPSKDSDKKVKRFSLDQHQTVLPYQKQTSETNIYRSSMAIMTSQKMNVNNGVQVNNNQHVSSLQQQRRDEPKHNLQEQQSTPIQINRDFPCSRTSDYHSSVDTVVMPQRRFTRQSQYRTVSNSIDPTDNDSKISTTYKTSHNFEQQQSSTYPWNVEQQRPIYGSDSYLMNSNGSKSIINNHIRMSKIIVASEQDESQNLIKSASASSKQVLYHHPQTPIDSNRKLPSTSTGFGSYASVRTGLSSVANGVTASSNQRQQAFRFLNMNSPRYEQ